ncbi:MAG TPA: MBL fold metallo-hydrolase [Solirubrobacter sp.]|nr:MBL fold metallo-hydrolase [Solirubrobacter sp.]
MKIRFLGTGASGGTPGAGRSRRRESSLLAEFGGTRLLVDVTRDFAEQAERVAGVDAVLLTHSHSDACGGIAQLRTWLRRRGLGPVPLLAAPGTLDDVQRRFARLDHVVPIAVADGEQRACGAWRMRPLVVPHALRPYTPTYAWRLSAGGITVVYASDVAALTDRLRDFATGAKLLAIDGAMWHRRLFSHLTADAVLPELCVWDVGQIALTQIGRSAPPHEQLERAVRALCPRAFPAYDDLELTLA